MYASEMQAGNRHALSRRRMPGRVRPGFHLDMTPLVDVAFLLLTFFMFATTMAQPQIMEICLPKGVAVPDEPVRLALYLRDDGALFLAQGRSWPPRRLDAREAATTIERMASPGRATAVTLRIAATASYQRLVGLLDELREHAGAAGPGTAPTRADAAYEIEQMNGEERKEVDAL
ncbi:MAG: biopolymer transporter ExbD [Bacteroidetes bacterium]|nr:biopolymer transporter ExbD [Bacteroidota bacterium]